MADDGYGGGEGGKRALEDQRHNQNKRPRGGDFDQVVFRLIIRSVVAGGVIGKGGENIKRMRGEHDAKVVIPDCNGPERIIKVVTKDLDHGLDCIKDIIPCISDKKQSPDQSSVRIMVHQSHAGAIIGRAGFKIKELREKTGAHFKVFTETCPKSTERVVQLTGTPEVIVKAIQEVYTICTDTQIKGPVQEYDPFCYDLSYYDKYGGYLFEQGEEERGYGGGGGGGGGGQWNRGGHQMGGHSRGRGGYDRMGGGNENFGFGRSPFGGGGGGGPMGGGMGMRGRGGRGGRGGMGGPRNFGGGGPQFSGQGFEFGGDRGHGGYGGGGGGGGFDGGAGGQEAVQTQQVTIPVDLAGSIIGKGGERIRNHRAKSGAQIKIGDPAPGGKDRVITITGTEDAIAHAKFLLQQSVRESQSRGGGN